MPRLLSAASCAAVRTLFQTRTSSISPKNDLSNKPAPALPMQSGCVELAKAKASFVTCATCTPFKYNVPTEPLKVNATCDQVFNGTVALLLT